MIELIAVIIEGVTAPLIVLALVLGVMMVASGVQHMQMLRLPNQPPPWTPDAHKGCTDEHQGEVT